MTLSLFVQVCLRILPLRRQLLWQLLQRCPKSWEGLEVAASSNLTSPLMARSALRNVTEAHLPAGQLQSKCHVNHNPIALACQRQSASPAEPQSAQIPCAICIYSDPDPVSNKAAAYRAVLYCCTSVAEDTASIVPNLASMAFQSVLQMWSASLHALFSCGPQLQLQERRKNI